MNERFIEMLKLVFEYNNTLLFANSNIELLKGNLLVSHDGSVKLADFGVTGSDIKFWSNIV